MAKRFAVKITKKEIFLLNKHLNTQQLINDISSAFVLSIKKGIERTSRDIDGKPFARLSNRTIAEKRKKGYSNPDKPLWAEGIMKEVYVKKKATKGRPVSQVSIPQRKERRVIGVKHIKGTGVKARKWFGIGKTQEKEAKKIARLAIKSALMKGKARR